MLTLRDVRDVATLYVPRVALLQNIWDYSGWGPGHELAHALLSTRAERECPGFGLEDPFGEGYRRDYALIVEAAAMTISFKLHRACGRHRLVTDEIDATDHHSVALLDTWKPRKLLRNRGCARIPRTREGLIALCRRRGLVEQHEPIRERALTLFQRIDRQ